ELFMDRAAGQSNEPFLELLKRPPIHLELASSASLPRVQAAPPAAPAAWEKEAALNAEKPAGSGANHGLLAEPWQTFQEAQASFAADAPRQFEAEPAPWEIPTAMDNANAKGASTWEDGKEPQPATAADPWANPFADPVGADPSAPPAWLSMLTQSEREQLTGAMTNPAPTEQPLTPSQPSAPLTGSGATWGSDTNSSSPQPAVPASSSGTSWKAEPVPAANNQDTSSFGPEWLKSLGAAALEEDAPLYQPPSRPAQSELQQETGELWKIVAQSQTDVAQSASANPPADAAREKAEQNFVTTLEELEQSLLSQGFTQLEPNSLASIARSQGASPIAKAEPDFSSTAVWPEEAEPDAVISSALAELSGFAQDPVIGTPAIPLQPSGDENRTPAGPVFEPASSWQPTNPPPASVPGQSEIVPGPVFEPKP